MADLEEIKKQYSLADTEGRKWLKVQMNEKDYFLNEIATIHVNMANSLKRHCAYAYGKAMLEEK